MQTLLVLILAIGAGAFFFKSNHKLPIVEEAAAPEVITNPTYAEIRMKVTGPARSIDQVMYAQTIDQADCKRFSEQVVKDFMKYQAEHTSQYRNIVTWEFQSSECLSELAPRYAKLFDNEPSSVTYLSVARGDKRERESRVIYWGVTVDESNKICDIIPVIQKDHKGQVMCIRHSES